MELAFGFQHALAGQHLAWLLQVCISHLRTQSVAWVHFARAGPLCVGVRNMFLLICFLKRKLNTFMDA